MSRITTHVLDTSSGKPGKKIRIELFRNDSEIWKLIAEGITNDDGRLSDLPENSDTEKTGVYKLKFHTGEYFVSEGKDSFYPFAEVVFKVNGDFHYHVPLLISPFAYSTYRGS
ncbi:MAG: hydroxyisourate hydrolase [Bacteroidetes bacterium]|nr:hydroxyisourate hydrolase [Bacteroidota bacterium]